MVWYAYVLGLRPSGSPQAVTLHAFSVRVYEQLSTNNGLAPQFAKWENKAE